MGITLLTKEIKPNNIFYRNEVQYSYDVSTKSKVGKGCEVTKLKLALPATSISYFHCPNYPNCYLCT